MESKKWFTDSFRRNLVDMHIEDWDERFLSQFDPEQYYQNLVNAKIRSAMIYFHSHVGYSYYPTKTGKMHSGLIGREDAIKRLVDLCHKGGIDVIGYYSLVFNTFEEDRHPEWRIIDSDDDTSERQRGSRYGHCCPNNQEYRAYLEAQIKEISEYFTVDGMFYDMTYWHGCCHCPSCRERYLREEGRAIPTKVDLANPEWKRFMHKRYDWIGEFAHYVTSLSKKYMPHASVEHNYAYGVAGDWNQAVTERTNDACDYSGGDLGGDQFIESYAAKYYRAVTKNPPFEYMIYRCTPNLAQHTVTKTETQLELEVMLSAAHHGASFIIDALDPVGTLNPRVYSMIGRVFEKLIPYEKYLLDGEPIEDVGVYYSSSGRYNTLGQDFDNRTCGANLVRTLVMHNIPTGIVTNADERIDEKFKLVFAPAIAGLEARDREKLINYVRNGGDLYISGGEEPKLLYELTGIELGGYTDTKHTYLAPTEKYSTVFGEDYDAKYPLPANYRLPYAKLTREAEVIATLTLPYIDPNDPSKFSSIHSNPPADPTDIPTLVLANYGKGRVVWSASVLEYDKRDMYMRAIMNIFELLCSKQELSVLSNAPRQVEICAYKLGGRYQINCVNIGATAEHLPVPSFEIALKVGSIDSEPRAVILPEGEPIECRYDGNYVRFDVSDLDIFRMIELSCEN